MGNPALLLLADGLVIEVGVADKDVVVKGEVVARQGVKPLSARPTADHHLGGETFGGQHLGFQFVL
jgi:hypothetical protein